MRVDRGGWMRGVGGEIITSSEVEQTGLFPFYFNHITNFPPRKGATSRYPHLISKYIWIGQMSLELQMLSQVSIH